VLNPLKLVIDNYPEDRVEEFSAANHPQKPEMGSRLIPFCREIYIEQEDFQENPEKGFHRLAPGQEVRLRYACIVKCTDVVKDDQGNVVEVHCTYDPDTYTGGPAAGRKVKGTIHWVSARLAVPVEVRLYDRLFSVANPGGDDWKGLLNPDSVNILKSCLVEPGLKKSLPEERYQFERMGYFYVDSKDSRPGAPVFNRTVTLRDSWTQKK
jgi:glutaminyl-tRNA synthetase